jgi:8-oxo-dGTP diphosphatase
MPPPDDSTARVPLGPIGRYTIANLEHLRRVRGLTYREMSDRLAQIGRPIPTLGLSRIEKGNRRVDVDDLVALAAVLECSPVDLLQPRNSDVGEDGWVRVAEGLQVPANRAGEWMAGLTMLPPQVSLPWPRSVTAAWLRSSEMADMRRRIEQLEAALGAERARNGHTQEEPLQSAAVPEPPADRPQRPAVITAIVTSSKGVLIGRRNDGKPPWTFIAGENEPRESPADTIVREVKEETGLVIVAGDILGERVHPKTGRHMVYVAARPAGRSLKVIVGDTDELAEVRWVNLAEADELLPGMFEPVREHLAREIGEG